MHRVYSARCIGARVSEVLFALLTSLLGRTVAEEIGAACQSLARWLIKRSAVMLTDDQERYEEQWLADLDDRKTPLRKLVFALGIVRAAGVLRRESPRVRPRAKKEPTIQPEKELNSRLMSREDRDAMVKGYEFAKDQYVHFTDEEIEFLKRTSPRPPVRRH